LIEIVDQSSHHDLRFANEPVDFVIESTGFAINLLINRLDHFGEQLEAMLYVLKDDVKSFLKARSASSDVPASLGVRLCILLPDCRIFLVHPIEAIRSFLPHPIEAIRSFLPHPIEAIRGFLPQRRSFLPQQFEPSLQFVVSHGTPFYSARIRAPCRTRLMLFSRNTVAFRRPMSSGGTPT
jgi:hypothetical protein